MCVGEESNFKGTQTCNFQKKYIFIISVRVFFEQTSYITSYKLFALVIAKMVNTLIVKLIYFDTEINGKELTLLTETPFNSLIILCLLFSLLGSVAA